MLTSGLRNGEDEAAIFAFDISLARDVSFTTELCTGCADLTEFKPLGHHLVHDAIASASRTMAQRANRRRALVVLTDGIDTGSKLTPAEVSGIASSIDVPVYIVGGRADDSTIPRIEAREQTRRLAGRTGGSGAVDRRQLVRGEPRPGGQRRCAADWSTSFAIST